MYPNPYVLEKLAGHKEEEIQRRAKHAWVLPPRRPALSARLSGLLVLGALVSCGLLAWLA